MIEKLRTYACLIAPAVLVLLLLSQAGVAHAHEDASSGGIFVHKHLTNDDADAHHSHGLNRNEAPFIDDEAAALALAFPDGGYRPVFEKKSIDKDGQAAVIDSAASVKHPPGIIIEGVDQVFNSPPRHVQGSLRAPPIIVNLIP